MTNLDPSLSRMSSPTSPRRCRWCFGIRRGIQSPPLPACGRCRSPARSSAGTATDCRYRPGAPVYRPCVVTVDDAIVAIQRDDQHRSPIVCWFSSQLAWVSRSPMSAGQPPKSRAEGRSGAVRECPQLPARARWIGHVEGTGMRNCARPIWPERASSIAMPARRSRRAGVLGPGSVIGGARTSNLGIGGSMDRHEVRAPTGLHYACMQRCGDSLRESSPRSARWECRG